jgi:hypothetical protein
MINYLWISTSQAASRSRRFTGEREINENIGAVRKVLINNIILKFSLILWRLIMYLLPEGEKNKEYSVGLCQRRIAMYTCCCKYTHLN